VSLIFESAPVSAPTAIDLDRLVAARDGIDVRQLRDAFMARGAAEERLQQLLDGALCVTTGQQPGLLTGPLFTVYKALTAVALADALQDRLGRDVVPVFWVAGDDHDLIESNHVHYLTNQNELHRAAVGERSSDDPLTPLYREALGADIVRVLDELEHALPPTEFRDGVFSWLREHYRASNDFASAFAASLADLLGEFGVVVFRPTEAAAKTAMAPRLLQALTQAGALNEALERTATGLQQDGGAAPVPVGDGASLVMIEGAQGRDRLVVQGAGFVTRRSGESWTMETLEQVAREEPQRLSPNVLLRPVVEASLLPTLAYVAGPGELRYLPQCRPVYDALGVVAQAPFPRWSSFAVEPRVTKVLEKYGVSLDDLQRNDLESSLVRDDMSDEIREPLTALRTTLAREYQALQDAVVAVDPTLKKSVQSTRNASMTGLKDLEKRIVALLKKRNEIVVQQIDKARQNVYPTGKPQERVFTIAPYLVRYGRAFLDLALTAARAHVGACLPP
jgi:bacillithiol biosynthesis cysteine-adding enzyme BshC